MRARARHAALGLAACALALPLVGIPPAHAVDQAPTNVRLAWDTGSSWRIRVTWDDAEGTANRVQFAGQEGVPALVGGGAPNVALLDAGSAPWPMRAAIRISVEVGDVGGATSPAGLSAEFDGNVEGMAVIDSLVPHGTTFTLRWHTPPVTDPNPDDPLDEIPAGRRLGIVWGPAIDCGAISSESFPVTQLPSTYTPAKPFLPGRLMVENASPWGMVPNEGMGLFTTAIPTTVATRTTYGSTVAVAGSSGRQAAVRGAGSCALLSQPEAGRLVHLQARNSSAGPWYGVGTTSTASDGTFRFAPPAIGTRQFRVVESAVPWPNQTVTMDGLPAALSAGVTPPLTAGTLARVRSARFLQPTLRRGDRTTAHLWVGPELATTALLQRWSAGQWSNVKQVAMSGGVADYRFTPNASSGWRWVIPTSRAPNGLMIGWTASAPFWVTVS